MNIAQFKNAVENAVSDALDIGETYASIQVVIRDPDHYNQVLSITEVEYCNGFLYIITGEPQ